MDPLWLLLIVPVALIAGFLLSVPIIRFLIGRLPRWPQ